MPALIDSPWRELARIIQDEATEVEAGKDAIDQVNAPSLEESAIDDQKIR